FAAGPNHDTLSAMHQEIGTRANEAGDATTSKRSTAAMATCRTKSLTSVAFAGLIALAAVACAGSSGSSGAKSAPDATTRTGQSPHGQTSAPPPVDEPNNGRGLNELLTSSGAREDAVEQLVREYKHVAKNGN